MFLWILVKVLFVCEKRMIRMRKHKLISKNVTFLLCRNVSLYQYFILYTRALHVKSLFPTFYYTFLYIYYLYNISLAYRSDCTHVSSVKLLCHYYVIISQTHKAKNAQKHYRFSQWVFFLLLVISISVNDMIHT